MIKVTRVGIYTDDPRNAFPRWTSNLKRIKDAIIGGEEVMIEYIDENGKKTADLISDLQGKEVQVGTEIITINGEEEEDEEAEELDEVTPPGAEYVVKGLKKSNVKSPWAVAWAMRNKGAHFRKGPHAGKKMRDVGEELDEEFKNFNKDMIENFTEKVAAINELDSIAINLNEAKEKSIGSLERGDVIIDPHGVEFYVHWSRINRRYTGVEVFGSRLEYLKDIQDNKKFSTWKFKGTQRTTKITSKVSTTLQNRFERAWRDQETKRYEKEQKQLDTISPNWKRTQDNYKGGYMTIKAKDGKEYKAGDIVDVGWSNGTAPAILGNLEGKLYNQAGEIAVMDIKSIGWGRAKSRFLPPEYILGASENASKYNVQDLLQQARGNKEKYDIRKEKKKELRRQFGWETES
jgi:hypothetical protein